MHRSALVLLAVWALLAACGGKAENDPENQPRPLSADEQWSEIADRGWEVVRLAGDDLVPGTYVDLHLTSDWKASGNAGCNTWYAFVSTRQGNRIRFTRLTQATRMDCASPKDIMEQEERFFEALQLVDSFELDGDQLVLYIGNDPVMVLTPKRPRS